MIFTVDAFHGGMHGKEALLKKVLDVVVDDDDGNIHC
jgi:hypothetical protein